MVRSGVEAVQHPRGRGHGLLLDVGRRFQDAGITLDDLGIRRPTLDEVFLSLTGSPVQDHAHARDNVTAPKTEAAK